jgi:methionine sulfoxide reductase heme-binding subunit
MMLTAAIGGKSLWYLTRGTGTMALVLLTASVLLGILEMKRWQSHRWPRFVTAGLHRSLSLLSVAFVAVHVATTVVDGFAPIGWIDAVVPFHSPYRPLWLGLGAVSVDLLMALVLTSLLRGRLGYRAWRAVHWAAYACWPIALVHGLGTGTDVRQTWAIALNLACLAAIVGAVWWRLAEAWDGRPRAWDTGPAAVGRRGVFPAAVASVVMPVAVVAWLLAGPLQPGWARRSGTPKAVPQSAAPSARAATASAGTVALPAPPSSVIAAVPSPPTVAPATVPQASTPFRLPATAELQGRLSQTADGEAQATVTIDTTLSGPTAGRLVIVLHGSALADGGIAMRTSQVSVGPAADPARYHGTVTALQGPRLTLALAGPGSEEVVVLVRLAIAGGAVSGTMTAAGPGE